MINERMIEQMHRAGDRYVRDCERREERRRQVSQVRRNRKDVDWSVIDEGQRINARAQMLGIAMGGFERGKPNELRMLERILAEDALISADFLRVGAQVSSCVGRVHIRDGHGRRAGFGTAFMVSPRLMMTNNHVLPRADHATNSTIEFDFVEGLLDSVQTSRFFSLDPATFFLTSPGLDYTIVAVGAAYGESEAQRRGWLTLIEESGKVLVGERLNIIQHPGGGPQKVGLRQNELVSVQDNFLIYGTDTEPGSSGSPVCNDQWLLAALHHASVPEHDKDGLFVRWVANEGVRISRIVADVRVRLRRSTESTKALFDAAFLNMPRRVADASGGAPRPDGSVEIPIRLMVHVNGGESDRVMCGVSAAPSASAAHTKGVQDSAGTRPAPTERDEFLDPPDGLPAFANPQLECIVVRMTEDADVSCIQEMLGKRWTVEDVDAATDWSPRYFDVLPGWEITVAEAWGVVHELRADKRVLLAEPSWEVDSTIEETRRLEGSAEFFGYKTPTDHAAEKKHWAPDLIGVRQAWSVPPPAGGKKRGEGIRIAHPDSGYTRHGELWERPDAIDVESGFDYVGDDADAFDTDGFHGTGTASVLMSGDGRDILGVAPDATLVPMRVAQKGWLRPAPVLLRAGMRRLRRAIDRAIQEHCHVVSISLGWLGNAALHDAVRRAWDQNIIIVAAAGNFTGRLIVWPARYRECICMAGCDAQRGIWEGSARGSRVDFTAPAQDVWKAGFDEGIEISAQASGTSFATAMTAGVAALWLAFHGRDNLIQRYQGSGARLAEVFRTVIERSADPAPGSWFGGFGGIVNAERALKTRLPEPHEIRKSFEQEAATEGIDIPAGARGPSLNTALEILGEDYSVGRRRLADGLGVGEEELEDIADGCGDELAFHTILAMRQSVLAAQESLGVANLEPLQMSKRLRSQIGGGRMGTSDA